MAAHTEQVQHRCARGDQRLTRCGFTPCTTHRLHRIRANCASPNLHRWRHDSTPRLQGAPPRQHREQRRRTAGNTAAHNDEFPGVHRERHTIKRSHGDVGVPQSRADFFAQIVNGHEHLRLGERKMVKRGHAPPYSGFALTTSPIHCRHDQFIAGRGFARNCGEWNVRAKNTLSPSTRRNREDAKDCNKILVLFFAPSQFLSALRVQKCFAPSAVLTARPRRKRQLYALSLARWNEAIAFAMGAGS